MARKQQKVNHRPSSKMVDREKVARLAYELYQARGGEPGRDLEDWLTAERMLLEQSAPRPERGKHSSDQRTRMEDKFTSR